MLIGHKKQWQFLKKSLDLDRLSHAYLFCGEEKLGKKTLAFSWLSEIFGEDIVKKQNPDFLFIEPINKEIQISQIRELALRFSLKSFSDSFKAAVIDKAHLMNSEAQNCFLKTLEEPKGKTILILITEYPETILPTIISRCETIKFQPVEKKEIEDYLKTKELSKERIEQILKISMGKPGMAMDLTTDLEKLENNEKIINELKALLNSDISKRFQYVKNISEKNNLKEVLEIWLNYFRGILIAKIKGEAILKNYSFLKLKNIIQNVQNTNFLISTTNVNTRLALENLMLEF